MSSLSQSYRKVRYDLRPAKQVERLMLIDALHRLSNAGFPIHEYQYTGMGSVHFYDFSLFHKYVGFQRMLSVEASLEIEQRVRFNRPFRLVQIKMATIGDVIPTLPEKLHHLVWLDYDSTMQPSYLNDVAQAVSHCRPGSIVLITVDVNEPKGAIGPSSIKEHYDAEFGDAMPEGLRPIDFSPKNLHKIGSQMIWRAVQKGLHGRQGIDFKLLFHFLYQDGHKMLTIGGMICDTDAGDRLRKAQLKSEPFVRTNIRHRPYLINIPVLTRKERLFLDASMPCQDNWVPRMLGMTAAEIASYRQIYRFAPQFAELIL